MNLRLADLVTQMTQPATSTTVASSSVPVHFTPDQTEDFHGALDFDDEEDVFNEVREEAEVREARVVETEEKRKLQVEDKDDDSNPSDKDLEAEVIESGDENDAGSLSTAESPLKPTSYQPLEVQEEKSPVPEFDVQKALNLPFDVDEFVEPTSEVVPSPAVKICVTFRL